jgi:hypothetical protein
MGTRGTYGVRKNGVDKLTYNHYDSYPDYLGREIVEFLTLFGTENLHKFYDSIIIVEESSEPTAEQITYCKENGFCDFNVSSRSEKDWYCLVRNLQGNFNKYRELVNDDKKIYMTNGNDFIKDSLWCEYGYIINLDEEVLEFYKGFQTVSQEGNRYGTEKYYKDYYPCKMVFKIPLSEINDVDEIVNMMNGEEEEDIPKF